MPAAVAIPLALAGGSAISRVISAKSQSGAARDASNAQVAAANHAADLQSKSAADALAFQKDQAARDQQNYVNTQLANYGQYTNRQQNIGQLGQLLGLPARNIPPPPEYLTSQQTTPNSSTMTAGADPKIAAFVADWQKTHPVSEGIAPIADALKKAGLSSGRFDYGGGNLSNNEVTVGGKPYKVLGGEGTPAAYWYVPGTNDAPSRAQGAMQPKASTTPISALFAPSSRLLTPALTMPGVNPFGVN